jgi:formate dehydrogenase subunit gamma
MAKGFKNQIAAVRDDRPQWAGAARAAIVIEAHRKMPGAMLPLLHALQAEFGYIPPEAEPAIATALNLSRAEVFGVISFYHDFRREPAGRHVLKICRAEACQAMGAVTLASDLIARLGLDWGGKTLDDRLTVEPSFCLGLCACAPAALYDGEPLGRVDRAMLDELVALA